MRFSIGRGQAVAIALAFIFGPVLNARADGLFHHIIPRETLAMDYRTGDVMMAPPIPGGHYTKDCPGSIKNAAGKIIGCIHGLGTKVKGLCGKCGSALCGNCGGNGLFHGKSCGSCGGDGCGTCGSAGLHHDGGPLGRLGHKKHGFHGGCTGPGCGMLPSAQVGMMAAPPSKAAGQSFVQAEPQQAMGSGQYAPVCGGCLGTGQMVKGGGCGACGGSGRLRGLLGHHGASNPCESCGGRGCGLCGGNGNGGDGNFGNDGHGGHAGQGGNGSACNACGGRGCGLCSGLKNKAHGILGMPKALCAKITHKGQIKYFVGAGGPVPLTPGYVPYVITTRSPRDFLAFPPFSDQIP